MRITKIELKKYTPHSHDIIEITTLEGNKYQLMDWEIEYLLAENNELLAEDEDYKGMYIK